MQTYHDKWKYIYLMFILWNIKMSLVYVVNHWLINVCKVLLIISFISFFSYRITSWTLKSLEDLGRFELAASKPPYRELGFGRIWWWSSLSPSLSSLFVIIIVIAKIILIIIICHHHSCRQNCCFHHRWSRLWQSLSGILCWWRWLEKWSHDIDDREIDHRCYEDHSLIYMKIIEKMSKE